MPETPRTVDLDELDARDLDDFEPRLQAVGYELRPEKMRPSVWVFEAGDAMNRHHQREQEELYHVLSGRFELAVGEDADTEAVTELSGGEVTVVDPATVRQLRCVEDGKVFAVGAPNVTDDAVVVERVVEQD